MRTLLEIAGSVPEDCTVKKMVLLGPVALATQGTIVLKGQCFEILTTTQTLEVLVLLVTSVQWDHHPHLPALVARTPPSGNRVNAVFVLLAISVQMLQPTSRNALKVSFAPMVLHQLLHVRREAIRITPWVINLMIASCAQLVCTVSLMACLGPQACVQVAGIALVDHGKGCHSTSAI